MNPFITPADLENLAYPTDAEIESLRKQNPALADRLFPVRYEGGIDADESLVAA